MALSALFAIPVVRDFLLGGKGLAAFRTIAIKHSLPPERASEFLDLCNAVLDEKLPMTEVPGIIAEAFGVDVKTAEAIAADIFGERILPLEAFVPGVREQIVAWGGKPEDYAEFRIGKEKVTAFLWSKRLAEKANIGFSDVLLKRLAFLLEGRMNGQKNAESLKTFFGRSLTIGGLGLSKEQNDALLAAIEGEAPYVELVSEEDAKAVEGVKEVEEVIEEAAGVDVSVDPSKGMIEASSHEVAAEVPVRTPIVPIPEEKPDAASTKKAKMLAGESGSKLRQAFEEAIATTLKEAMPILRKKKISEKQFADIAGKAIRGVRDLNQTRDIFEAEYKMKVDESSALMAAIEKGSDVYNGAAGVDVPVDPSTALSEEVAEGIEEAEALVMNSRFAALTNSAPGKPLQPVMPGARVSAARSSGEEAKMQSDAMTAEEKKKALLAERPAPARAELTVGSVPPQAGRDARMTDVVAATRLLGPVEQLGSIGPVEFRRLSSSPDEAARKLEDMLTALEETSYEEKVKGIKAWHKSPMNQLYLAMAEAALSEGISVPEVSTKRRASGKESLSPAEIKALVGLNARLRF